jgi:hypothetical protein
MISIRNGVFETNSSSTHSIAIPQGAIKIPKYINFCLGEYGWETGSPNPASYLWTAICYNHPENIAKYRNKLSKICDKYSIGRDYQMPEYDECGYMKYGYIDHGDELNDFINMLFEDEDKLIKFISDGLVFTGNDNCDEDREYINRKKEFVNYDWYYKGN